MNKTNLKSAEYKSPEVMKEKAFDFWSQIFGILFGSIPIIVIIAGLVDKLSKSQATETWFQVLGVGYILFMVYGIYMWMAKNNAKEETDKTKKEYVAKGVALEKQYKVRENALESSYRKKEAELLGRYAKMNDILHSCAPFSYSASLAADMREWVYEDAVTYLIRKKHPAYSAAQTVRELKDKARKSEMKYREMLYKFEFLMKTFPELERYVDDEEALQSLEQYSSISNFEENIDRTQDYLSKEEWERLSIDERNQLALDRYMSRKKSNWVIGIEYEMYIEYLLRKKGLATIPFGSIKGIEDLGRDIIAYKFNEQLGGDDYYIIQCKNWSVKSGKEIHENVICQIYGTSIEFALRRNIFTDRVYPVIATTVPLSDMAKKFADKLGVIQWNIQKGDCPMIKCNVSANGEKIYHLPFDQQYYTTKIEKQGEFYAWTVEEAVRNGFRRAFRHKN